MKVARYWAIIAFTEVKAGHCNFNEVVQTEPRAVYGSVYKFHMSIVARKVKSRLESEGVGNYHFNSIVMFDNFVHRDRHGPLLLNRPEIAVVDKHWRRQVWIRVIERPVTGVELVSKIGLDVKVATHPLE